jgi:hypothetical protein
VNSEWRRGILIGLIASILFVLLVQPIMRFAGSAIINVSGLVSQTLSNMIYTRAARGIAYSLTALTMASGASGLFFGLGCGFFAHGLWRSTGGAPLPW